MTHVAKAEGEATPKLLIANRGEICIRICRAARELSLPTVAIYSFEDRYSDHYQCKSQNERQSIFDQECSVLTDTTDADESYMLGEQGQFGPM